MMGIDLNTLAVSLLQAVTSPRHNSCELRSTHGHYNSGADRVDRGDVRSPKLFLERNAESNLFRNLQRFHRIIFHEELCFF